MDLTRLIVFLWAFSMGKLTINGIYGNFGKFVVYTIGALSLAYCLSLWADDKKNSKRRT